MLPTTFWKRPMARFKNWLDAILGAFEIFNQRG